MPANVQPVFSIAPNIGMVNLTSASTDHLGGGAVTLFTAGANGSFISQITATPLGNCAASVLRIWINNGGTYATTTNNVLWNEVSLPVTTSTEVAAQTQIVVTLNFPIPATYRIGVAIGTTVSAGWAVACLGGSY